MVLLLVVLLVSLEVNYVHYYVGVPFAGLADATGKVNVNVLVPGNGREQQTLDRAVFGQFCRRPERTSRHSHPDLRLSGQKRFRADRQLQSGADFVVTGSIDQEDERIPGNFKRFWRY